MHCCKTQGKSAVFVALEQEFWWCALFGGVIKVPVLITSWDTGVPPVNSMSSLTSNVNVVSESAYLRPLLIPMYFIEESQAERNHHLVHLRDKQNSDGSRRSVRLCFPKRR